LKCVSTPIEFTNESAAAAETAGSGEEPLTIATCDAVGAGEGLAAAGDCDATGAGLSVVLAAAVGAEDLFEGPATGNELPPPPLQAPSRNNDRISDVRSISRFVLRDILT
jgi:hypothetical protein